MPTGEAPIPFGATLRQLRVAAGLSLTDLARRVHYSKSHLSKVETGRKIPSPHLARRCDAALGADGALAALVPPVPGGRSMFLDGRLDDHWVISVDGSGHGRFDAIPHRDAPAEHAASPSTWAMPPGVGSRRDDLSELHVFRSMFDEMRRLGQAMAPAAMLPVLIAQTHALRLLATTAAPLVRTRALLLASRFGEYTGWIAQEAGNDHGALWWTDRALEFAAAGGDRELASYALVRRGLVAMYRHDAQETVALATRAQATRCSSRIRGLAALREAQGHALAGSYDQCRRALDRGAVLLESATADDELPILGTSTTPDLVQMVTGWCLHDLGRSRLAAEHLTDALASVPEYAHRTRVRISARLSLALVAAGELEHSCIVLDGLLDVATLVDSATVRTDLRRLAQELNRRHTQQSVRDVMPRLIGALRTDYR